jgi:hypothetical protein
MADPWSASELAILQANFQYGRAEVARLLPGKTPNAIRARAAKLGLHVTMLDRRRYPVNDEAFSTWSEFSAYWLGFLAADGCIKDDGEIVLYLSAKDTSHLILFRNALIPDSPIYTQRRKSGQAVSVRFRSAPIYDFLISLGITPRKSSVLAFPIALPDTMFAHFMRGYSCVNPQCGWSGDADFNGACMIARLGDSVMVPGGPGLNGPLNPRATTSSRL